MEKRALFNHRLLPYALLLPQIVVTVIFFYWPASQAVWQSFLLQDAFGLSTKFVWMENYRELFHDGAYYRTIWTTLVFSGLVAILSLSCALLLATQADKQLRGAGVYRTLLIWPYAVAPAIAGVLWAFMFQPSFGVIARMLRDTFGVDWNPLLNENHAMTMVVMAATWKQISYNFLFFLAGPRGDPAQRDRGGRNRRRAPDAPLLDHHLPAALADDVLPAGGQHRLRVLRHLRHHRRDDRRRPRQGDRNAGLQASMPTGGSAATSAARRRNRSS